MPIYEFGYRHWEGNLRARWLRWWPITRVGVRLALSSRLLRRLLFAAWAPLLFFGPLFFAVGYFTESGADRDWAELAASFLGPDLTRQVQENPNEIRPIAWSWLFCVFLSIPQNLGLLFVVAIVGPPLVAHDVRSKGFLLYFSKPIAPSDYVLGKGGVLLAYIGFVTLLPALVLYIVSIAFSPSLAAILQTSWTVVRIIAASLAVAIPSTLLMLFYSSLTRDPRYAAFAWIATYMVGKFFYLILCAASPTFRESRYTFLISLHDLTLAATRGIFDMGGRLEDVASTYPGMQVLFRGWMQSAPLAIAMLSAISVVSLVGLFRRITAPVRI